MAIQPEQQNPSLLLDALYCEEEKWVDEKEEEEEEGEEFLQYSGSGSHFYRTKESPFLYPPSFLLEQDLFWEDEELISLFSKEKEQQRVLNVLEKDVSLSMARREAVDLMIKVNARYGFSALTAILGINYLDRFLCRPCYHHRDKPWMIQLVAVACLSLAAKVEETQVPLLLDLQVEETKYMFEAKTIQRMELLVLSTLKWRMHPVTPLSFLDHIVRRLGLKTHLHWEFLRRCERLLLSIVSDSRSVSYLPSLLATAAMMHVIDQVEPFNPLEYQNQLLSVLKMSKERVNGCLELIQELPRATTNHQLQSSSLVIDQSSSLKRKHEQQQLPGAGNSGGVTDAAAVSSCDSSNDSWAPGGIGGSSSPNSMVQNPSSSSSPQEELEPLFKKSRTQDQWVFVDMVGSPSS